MWTTTSGSKLVWNSVQYSFVMCIWVLDCIPYNYIVKRWDVRCPVTFSNKKFLGKIDVKNMIIITKVQNLIKPIKSNNSRCLERQKQRINVPTPIISVRQTWEIFSGTGVFVIVLCGVRIWMNANVFGDSLGYVQCRRILYCRSSFYGFSWLRKIRHFRLQHISFHFTSIDNILYDN